jgi:hypothetical protein
VVGRESQTARLVEKSKRTAIDDSRWRSSPLYRRSANRVSPNGNKFHLGTAAIFLTVRQKLANIPTVAYRTDDTEFSTGFVLMENTLSPTAGDDSEQGAVAMTPLGKVLVLLLLVGGGFSAWTYGPNIVHAVAEPVNVVRAHMQHAGPATAKVSAQSAVSVEKPKAAQPTPTAQPAHAAPSAQAVAEQAQRDHLMQISVAGRAVAEQNRQRITELDSTMQGLDAKLSALLAQKPTTVTRAAREELSTAVKTVHANVAAAKEAATVDVAALPVEAVSAHAFGITSLTKGAVSLAGGQQVAVGQALRSGETVVAVDPESHAIVTNRRIINVTN